MWILRKKKDKLSDDDLKVMELLFKHSPQLEIAYKLCNDLTQIFEEDTSKYKAKRKIKKWMKRVNKSRLSCFNTFLGTLEKFIDEITNYFHDRQTSGFVEGLNTKIKVIKRRCYGIININHLFQRIYLDLRGYNVFA